MFDAIRRAAALVSAFLVGAALAFGLGLPLGMGDAHATQVRLDAMGGGFKYWTMEDETNVFDFPELLVRWGDLTSIDNLSLVSGNIPGANTRFAIHYQLTDDVVIAAFGGRIDSSTRAPSTTSGYAAAGNPYTGTSSLSVGGEASAAGGAQGGSATARGNGDPDPLYNVDLKVGLGFAVKLGERMRLGATLSIMGDNADVEQPDQDSAQVQKDQGAMIIDFGLGFGVDITPKHELEVGLGLEFGWLEDARDSVDPTSGQFVDLEEHWSATHLGVRINARHTFHITKKMALVSYARFLIGSQEVKNEFVLAANAQNGSWDAFDIHAGTDLRLEVAKDVWVVPGVGIRYAQQTLEGVGSIDRDLDRILTLPYYGVGVDIRVFEWLDFRFGAQQFVNLYRVSRTPQGQDTVEVQASDVITTVSTGLGFNVAIGESTLSLDVNINPNFWLNGIYIVSGATTNPFALTTALKFDWK